MEGVPGVTCGVGDAFPALPGALPALTGAFATALAGTLATALTAGEGAWAAPLDGPAAAVARGGAASVVVTGGVEGGGRSEAVDGDSPVVGGLAVAVPPEAGTPPLGSPPVNA